MTEAKTGEVDWVVAVVEMCKRTTDQTKECPVACQGETLEVEEKVVTEVEVD